VELKDAFEWLALSPDEHDPDRTKEIKALLLQLWDEVRERVGPERFTTTLGETRAGRFARRGESIWTQTNAEHEQGDYVNLTLEIDPDELSLNVIGWFDPQLEKVERWLGKPASWRFMRRLENWCIVVFVRRAPLDKNGRANFRGAPGEERERLPIGAGAATIATTLIGMRPHLDPDREKLSLHIRRSWSPTEVASLDDLPQSITAEVETWLGPLDQIRLA
jgi:hypothetical protein